MNRLEYDSQQWPLLTPLDEAVAAKGIVLNREVCVVGRARVHLPLISMQISRMHALLVNDGSSIYVRDLASKNGVFRNGEAVREAELRRSDVLGIGPFQFRCESGFEPESIEEDYGSGPSARLALEDSTIELPMMQRTFVIGTRDACDAAVKGIGVSTVHAVIFRRAGEHFVRDLNSHTGTFLNGRRTRESKLSHGDEIRIGTITLQYESQSDAASDVEVMSHDPIRSTEPLASDEDMAIPLAVDVEESFESELVEPSRREASEHKSKLDDDDDSSIRVWDPADEEADIPNAPEPLPISSDQPGQNAWPAETSGEPKVDIPSTNGNGNGDGEEHLSESTVDEGAQTTDPDRDDQDGRRSNELRVEHLLGRLSKNVVRLKSACRVLYEPHGRESDERSSSTSRGPD